MWDVAKNRKTPHEILKGRKSKKEMLEFGEAVHFIPVTSYKDLPKAEPRALDGIWLGLDYETDEYVVGYTNGNFTTRTVRRKLSALDGLWTMFAACGAFLGCHMPTPKTRPSPTRKSLTRTMPQHIPTRQTTPFHLHADSVLRELTWTNMATRPAVLDAMPQNIKDRIEITQSYVVNAYANASLVVLTTDT